MNIDQLMGEIKELNLSFLLLAQQMLREDKDSAIYRLGISQDLAGILEQLTPGQILKMAGSNMLLCRFRFDDHLILDMLAGYTRERTMASSHAAILMADQPVEQLT